MLAELGFLVTGVCFAAFAVTFWTFVLNKTKLELHQFSYAYFSLALALLTWGIAVSIGGDTLLKNSVLVGDLFLMCGTLFMLDILLSVRNQLWLLAAAVLSLWLLHIRAVSYPPHPEMHSGILLFNTQKPVAIVLSAIFLLVWLPANLKVAKLVTHKIKQDSISNLYSYIYIAATVSALIFIASRRTITVAISFAALGICFLMLLSSNLLVEALEDGRAAPKRPARKRK
jgi:hypothetical protein